MSTLGENIGRTLRELTGLYRALSDAAPEKETVHDQILDLSDKIHKLVDATIDARLEEYKDATKALETAADDIQAAKTDIAKVAKAVDSAAKAIDAIAKLLAVIAAGV